MIKDTTLAVLLSLEQEIGNSALVVEKLLAAKKELIGADTKELLVFMGSEERPFYIDAVRRLEVGHHQLAMLKRYLTARTHDLAPQVENNLILVQILLGCVRLVLSSIDRQITYMSASQPETWKNMWQMQLDALTRGQKLVAAHLKISESRTDTFGKALSSVSESLASLARVLANAHLEPADYDYAA